MRSHIVRYWITTSFLRKISIDGSRLGLSAAQPHEANSQGTSGVAPEEASIPAKMQIHHLKIIQCDFLQGTGIRVLRVGVYSPRSSSHRLCAAATSPTLSSCVWVCIMLWLERSWSQMEEHVPLFLQQPLAAREMLGVAPSHMEPEHTRTLKGLQSLINS